MIYLVPEDAVGHGLGHLQRLSTVAGRLSDPAVLVTRELRHGRAAHLARLGFELVPELPADAAGSVLFDKREIRSDAVSTLPPGVTTCAVDAAGTGRDWVDAVVDPLPGKGPVRRGALGVLRRSGPAANESGLFLPRLPRRRGELRGGPLAPADSGRSAPPQRILISFGGEDPAHLTELLCDRILRWRLARPEQLTIVRGPFFDRSVPIPEDVRGGGRGEVIDAPENLADILHEYELVVTSYGITAFEALAAGCRVLIVNPSRYHDRLTRRAGLARVGGPTPLLPGRIHISRRRLRRRLSGVPAPDIAAGSTGSGTSGGSGARGETAVPSGGGTAAGADPLRGAEAQAKELASVLRPYLHGEGLGCPLCGRRYNPALERLPGRSFFRCRDCGMIYLTAFGREPVVYDESYFFEEYRAQYGRSYLEDFDHIATMGARRLHTIADLLGPSRRPATGRNGAPSDATEEPSDATESPRVLDLGCAYGPFLQAAKEAGYRPFGIDISESAVDYVRKHLGVAAHAGRIGTVEPAELFGVDRFHVITMWYVIEHMEDLGEVLSWISELLMPGGVFAFSTPNYDGVSRRRNRRTFLARSPRDHRSIWSPRIAAKVLPRFGMELRKVRVTGHHPERFSLGSTMPTARPLLGAWSRLAGRGDTFEAYAVTRGRTRE